MRDRGGTHRGHRGAGGFATVAFGSSRSAPRSSVGWCSAARDVGTGSISAALATGAGRSTANRSRSAADDSRSASSRAISSRACSRPASRVPEPGGVRGGVGERGVALALGVARAPPPGPRQGRRDDARTRSARSRCARRYRLGVPGRSRPPLASIPTPCSMRAYASRSITADPVVGRGREITPDAIGVPSKGVHDRIGQGTEFFGTLGTHASKLTRDGLEVAAVAELAPQRAHRRKVSLRVQRVDRLARAPESGALRCRRRFGRVPRRLSTHGRVPHEPLRLTDRSAPGRRVGSQALRPVRGRGPRATGPPARA